VVLTVLVAAGIALLVGLFFVFRGGSDEKSGTSTTLEVTVQDGQPVGGIQHLTVDKGAHVTVRVTSEDVEDEVHVHGYDLMKDVAPGEPAEIAFQATITGRFEIELENAGVPIAELEVR
jgi:heme/copper-type cytochrome/quinol oxidase subunit 2